MKHTLLFTAIAAGLTFSAVTPSIADEKGAKEEAPAKEEATDDDAEEESGTGGTAAEYKAVGKLFLGHMGKAADIIETATDEASATTAAEKLSAVTKEFIVMVKKAKAMGKPSPEVDAELNKDEELQEMAKEVMQRFMTATVAIQSKPEVAKILAPSLEEFGKAAQSLNELDSGSEEGSADEGEEEEAPAAPKEN